jgi:hypothetical protein
MKRMSSKNFARNMVWAAAVAGFVSFVERSVAADYWVPPGDGVPALSHDKVQFASNWYVRGDLAYAQETYPKLVVRFNQFERIW